jgi:hypothetical protein
MVQPPVNFGVPDWYIVNYNHHFPREVGRFDFVIGEWVDASTQVGHQACIVTQLSQPRVCN